MKKLILIVSLIRLLLFNVNAQIINYEKFIGEYIDEDNNSYIILRRFKSNNTYEYLALDPFYLKVFSVKSNKVKKVDWAELEEAYYDTPYMQLRRNAKQLNKQNTYANRGIVNVKNQGKIVITTDLCPTKKSLNYSLYNQIMQRFQNANIPIGIPVSGKWIEQHPKDLQWLLNNQKQNKVSITWINHSYSHYYDKNLPIENNFMLSKHSNINDEVLGTEKIMLQKEMSMSVFFRFPGLISDKKLYQQVLDYGLIPLGADSWIAKEQNPKDGSVILLHGNGNELIGGKKFIRWLNSRKNIFKPISINEAFTE